jgi:glycine cleavage system H protein
MEFPEGLRYTKEHEWVAVEGKQARVGITDYAQDALGDIVYVEPPEVGRAVRAMEACAEVESTKSVSDIYTPVSGTILEVNSTLAGV